jgi:hypothetical protein
MLLIIKGYGAILTVVVFEFDEGGIPKQKASSISLPSMMVITRRPGRWRAKKLQQLPRNIHPLQGRMEVGAINLVLLVFLHDIRS